MMFLAMNMAIWYYGQQANLYAENRKLAQLQADRENEKLSVLYVLVGSNSGLNATVQNIGSVTVHIVHIIVTLVTPPMKHYLYSVSYYINPGNTTTNIGEPPALPAVFSSTSSYEVTFITERGNGYTNGYSPSQLTYAPYATFASLGYLSMGFTPQSLNFTSTGQSKPISAWAVANSGTTMCTSNVIFWVTFVNHGNFNANILQWSVLDIMPLSGTSGGNPHGNSWYVVSTKSTPSNLIAYTNNPVTVPASITGNLQVGGTPTTVAFAATGLDGTGGQTPYSCGADMIYDVFMLAVYTYNNQQYNQLVPFAGIVLVS
jgi:hypothetical protein